MVELAIIFCTHWAWRNGWGTRALIPGVSYGIIIVSGILAILSEGEVNPLGFGIGCFILSLFALSILIVMIFVKPQQSSIRPPKIKPKKQEAIIPPQEVIAPISEQDKLLARAKIAAEYREKLDQENRAEPGKFSL